MSGGFEEQVARLRREFDESFARAPEVQPRGTEEFLAIGAAGGQYALRLSQISLLARMPVLVPLPSAAESFLGVAAVRSGVVPVFSMARLLAQPAEAPAWLVVMARRREEDPRVGFAFARWDGYIREPAPEAGRAAVKVAYRGQSYVILDLFAFAETLQRAAGKEH